jgi:acyl carrier protein
LSSTIFGRVRAVAADVLDVSAERLDACASTETIETWDSLQHLNLVLALEQEFGVQFEPEEMERMTSVGRIVELLEAKAGQD